MTRLMTIHPEDTVGLMVGLEMFYVEYGLTEAVGGSKENNEDETLKVMFKLNEMFNTRDA